MIPKRRLNHIAMKRLFLIPVVFLFLITILSGIHQSWALEGVSTQTSCVNNRPCQTMVCSEGRPCKVTETPNADFDIEFDKDETDGVSQPFGGAGTGTGTGTGTGIAELAPFSNPYNNIYSEEQEEYLEDRQDMMEDAEYE
jgi:hypothetical protein